MLSLQGWGIIAGDDDGESLNALAMLLRIEGPMVNVAEAPSIALELLEGSEHNHLIRHQDAGHERP